MARQKTTVVSGGARPHIVYLVGGMGSGKSSVARILRELGAPVYDLDQAGHAALRLPEVKEALRSAFGEGVFDKEGEVVRRALAQAAFATPEGTAVLNRATTRAILELMNGWLAAQSSAPVCVVEVSAYDGPGGRFPDPDEVLAVVAPLEARVSRAVAKGFDEADVRVRISRQATDEERRSWANAVISNDGSMEDLRRAVESWWRSR